MKITIEATQAELDEMGLDSSDELGEYAIECLDSDGTYGNLDLSSYNVCVKVVDKEVY